MQRNQWRHKTKVKSRFKKEHNTHSSYSLFVLIQRIKKRRNHSFFAHFFTFWKKFMNYTMMLDSAWRNSSSSWNSRRYRQNRASYYNWNLRVKILIIRSSWTVSYVPKNWLSNKSCQWVLCVLLSHFRKSSGNRQQICHAACFTRKNDTVWHIPNSYHL